MEEAIRSPLAAWESFYVIVGSSGAALTGLQFVVIALIAESNRQSSSREIEAFGTPTIVHFTAVLLISAILSAPWRELSSISVALTICGLAGVMYGLVVIRRAKRQTGYRPVFEDWLWFALLPLIAYALLLGSAMFFGRNPERVLFVVAAVTLLLLIVGIHNAWDTVTFIAVGGFEKSPESKEQVESERPRP